MYKDLKFPVLIVHRDIKADTVAGERVRGIAHELEQDGFSILSTASSAEGSSICAAVSRIAPRIWVLRGTVSETTSETPPGTVR